MRKPVVMITGAAGEIGHALVDYLASGGEQSIITVDLRPLEPALDAKVSRSYAGTILDRELLDSIQAEFSVDRVFHLAALLSTRSEFTPVTAHEVNVRGTLNLLEFAMAQAGSHGHTVRFFYPSSIAAFGIPAGAEAPAAGWREDQHTAPTTMYGCNKLYCEHLGRYYARHYKQLDVESHEDKIDFRSLRFPGLISASTLPSGGTSDYAPEMIHAAAQRQPYDCFVRPDTQIPFMAMPDAVTAILELMRAEPEQLCQSVYNLSAFAPTADEVRDLVLTAFPGARIGYVVDDKRQAIVDSWPCRVDDRAARADWGFAPEFDLSSAFGDYLIPNIAQRYASP